MIVTEENKKENKINSKSQKTKNLKLYPIYRQLAQDFLFFYTINILFLTQIKKINMSDVVLVDTFYSLFVVLLQIPATMIIRKIGRKKGMVFGNICNCLYLILVINSSNLFNLILAEIFCAFGFSLKDIAEPAILNGSIEAEKIEKSNIFAKIQAKSVSGYYALSAISMILSGFLFEINGYIPMLLSLFIVIMTIIMSTRFKEVEDVSLSEENDKKSNSVSLKDSIIFSFKSKRCRCLLLFSAVFYAITVVLATYEVSLLEDLNISSKYIGILFAVLNIVSSFASTKQEIFQKKLKNRTLTIIGILISLTCIISGLVVLKTSLSLRAIFAVLTIMYIIKYITVGLFFVLVIKYLSNFTNSMIDTQIFAVNSFLQSIVSVIFGIFASKLVEIYSTANSMIIFGITSLISIIIILLYMKNKVGLEPEKYSSYELQYEKKV